MQSLDTDLWLFQDEEDEKQREQEEEEGVSPTVKQLILVGDEDAVAFKLRGGQAQIRVRELRSKGLSFQIWPAAHALCWYLEDTFAHTGMLQAHLSLSPTSQNCTFKRNMRVLELGAGTGMVGIVCAVLGGHCTITDLPHVTSNLEYNATLNQEAIQSSGLGGSVVVKSLRWGERADVEAVGNPFDLVVASDVVYYDHLFEPLLSTLKWLLCSPPSHTAASLQDGDVPTINTAMTTSSTSATAANGNLLSRFAKLEEGEATCVPTAKPIVDVSHSIEDLSFMMPSFTENATILEQVSLPVRGANATIINRGHSAEVTTETPCATCTVAAPNPAPPSNISANASRSMPLIGEGTTPVVLLAHLRRWKKDSHFFKKASKLFHVTIVHKHSHEANSRTGVTIYSISRKKK